MKFYRKSGQLLSEINYKNGKRSGLAKDYYKNGKLHHEMYYEENLQHGEAKTFYESGSIHSITPFFKGKIHGIEKKYRENGKLMSEMPYYMGLPAIGLKEYTSDGKLKKQYPEFKIELEDKILLENAAIVKAYFTEPGHAEYYKGKLKEDKYLTDDNFKVSGKNGVLELKYSLPPGTFVMEELYITGVRKTHLGNYLVKHQKYNLALENKGY